MTRAVSARELAEAIRAWPPASGAVPEPADPAGRSRPACRRPEPFERDDCTPSCCCAACPTRAPGPVLLARGYSNRRIADACYLSLNTVRTHVPERAVKLGVTQLEALHWPGQGCQLEPPGGARP
jgi:hypothetical protein